MRLSVGVEEGGTTPQYCQYIGPSPLIHTYLLLFIIRRSSAAYLAHHPSLLQGLQTALLGSLLDFIVDRHDPDFYMECETRGSENQRYYILRVWALLSKFPPPVIPTYKWCEIKCRQNIVASFSSTCRRACVPLLHTFPPHVVWVRCYVVPQVQPAVGPRVTIALRPPYITPPSYPPHSSPFARHPATDRHIMLCRHRLPMPTARLPLGFPGLPCN